MNRIRTFFALIVAIASLIAVTNAHGQSTSLSATTLEFGSVPLGSQGAEIVTITNSSTNTIAVMATVQGGTNGFSTDLAPLFFVMDPNDFLDINVFFDPIANGDAMDVLECDVVVFDVGGSPIGTEQETVELLGTGGPYDDPCDLIQDILNFFEDSIAVGTLEGTGCHPARRKRAMRNRLRAVGFLCRHGYFSFAAYINRTAILRSDGEPCPGDFVQGPDLQALNDQLELLQILLQ